MLGRITLFIYRFSIRLLSWLFTVTSRGAFQRLGRGSVIILPVRLVGESRIAIGEGVTIGTGSWLQVLPCAGGDNEPVITIGDGTSIAGFCTISAAQGVVIESNVLIARHVYISDHTHAHANRNVPILQQGIVNVAPVRIREGAWLGQSVVVGPGVTVGRGAVIGANSVVRGDIPDFSVAAGSPARVIRAVDEQRPS